MKKENLNSNIWKIYLIRGLKSFLLFIPIIVLFFQKNGLSMKEIFLLQSSFSVAVIILEIPTGYFSDIFGRKKSMIIGSFLATAGFAVYSLSYSFWGFFWAEITLGAGISFLSGADSAMLYDTLLAGKKEFEYKKVEGKAMGVGMFSESIASTIGGFLALISLRFPLYCDIAITSLAIPVSLTLAESKREKLRTTSSSLKKIVKTVKFSILDQKEIKWLIIYSAFVGASTLTMFWLMQPYLLAIEFPLGFFGVMLTICLLTAAFFSWKAHAVERFLGRKKSLILLIFLPALGYILLSSFWFIWSGIFILLFYIVRGINNPVILDYINGLISSDVRATILSIKNLVGRIIFSVIGPIIGWINDVFSLKAALLSSGITFLVLGLISLVFLHKHKAL